MSQPDAWLFQPTRVSIFFDLHEHIVFCERQEEHELMNIGRFSFAAARWLLLIAPIMTVHAKPAQPLMSVSAISKSTKTSNFNHSQPR